MMKLVSLATALTLAVLAAPLAVAAPVNDHFADRLALTGALPISVNGTTIGGTSEIGEPYFPYNGDSIWWKWTATEDGVVAAGTSGVYYYNAVTVFESVPPALPAGQEIVIDNTDAAAVTIVGDWTASTVAGGYLGTNYLHNGNAGQGTKSVTFTPTLPAAGDYDVYIRWTEDTNRATAVPVEVKHALGTSTYTVNQRTNGGQWVKLNAGGPLALDTTAKVTLRTEAADGYVIADAVRFVPMAAPSFATLRAVRTDNDYYAASASFPAHAGHTYQIAVSTYTPASSLQLVLQTTTQPTITSLPYATATVGQPFSYQITANNNPYSFYASGLPQGLSYDGITGLISGTPQAYGRYSCYLYAYGAGSTTNFLDLVVETLQPQITSPTVAAGIQGGQFSYQITATKSPTSYFARFLPPGLVLDTSSGLITGTPTSYASYSVDLAATNAEGTGPYTTVSFAIKTGAPAVPEKLLQVQVGDTISYQIVATQSPTSYTADTLPDGLILNSTTGLITGVAKAAGDLSIYLTATNSYGTGSGYLELKVYNPIADNFADRVPVSGKNFTILASNTNATREAGEPLHAGIEGGASIWYSWKAPETGTYRVTMSATFQYLLGIYEGSRVSALRSVIPPPPEGFSELNPLLLNAVAGHTYQIAVDGGGGEAGEFSLLVESLGKNPARVLTVDLSGHGSVTDGFLGTSYRRLGAEFTIVAKPAPGYVFESWGGSIFAATPKLKFTMQEDTALTANFIPNPVSVAKGTYLGLLTTGDDGVKAGRIKVQVAATGAFTASFALGGRNYGFSGVVSVDGTFTGTILRGNEWPLAVSFSLHLDDPTLAMTGSISSDVFSADFSAARATLDAAQNPAPQAGRYTWLINPPGDAVSSPAGYGYGTLVANKSGAVRWAGLLPDGTPASAGGTIADDGTWVLYIGLYQGRGLLTGVVTFLADSSSDFTGDLEWRRAAQPRAALYSGGYSVTTSTVGSRFATPPAGTSVLDFRGGDPAAIVLLDGPEVFNPVSEVDATVLPGDRLVAVDVPTFSMSISATTGFFTGKMLNPTTNRVTGFGGVVLQKNISGGGFMRMGPQTVPVTLQY